MRSHRLGSLVRALAHSLPHDSSTPSCCDLLTLSRARRLVHRTLQTLLKPVPELVNILGVDIPEPPDVCLAGIRSDAATLSWGRPPNGKPIQKYSIQVNGVHGQFCQHGLSPSTMHPATRVNANPSCSWRLPR